MRLIPLCFTAALLLQSSNAFVPRVPANVPVSVAKRMAIVAEADSKESLEEKSTLMDDGKAFEAKPFENNTLFSWLVPYLTLFGMKEGNTMYGVLPVAVDEDQRVGTEEAARRRAQAAVEFVNIGMEERERRDKMGDVFAVVTTVYVIWAALIGDDGDLQGHIFKFLSFIPFLFAIGLKLSSKAGL